MACGVGTAGAAAERETVLQWRLRQVREKIYDVRRWLAERIEP